MDADLNWSCNDDDGDILKYDIYLGTTNPPALVVTNHDSLSYDPGKLTVETDYYWQIVADDGFEKTYGQIWHFTTVTLQDNNAPEIPEKPSGSTFGYIDTSYSFTTKTDDIDGNTIQYEFDWDDGTKTLTGWYNPDETIDVSHSWTNEYVYYIHVKAYDGAEWSDISSKLKVKISKDVPPSPPPSPPPTPPSENNEPIADSGGPYSGFIGIPITFDGSKSYDSDGTIVEYSWDFGDGYIGDGVTPTYSYSDVGNYTITLTVKDNGSKTDVDTSYVIINEKANIPPETPSIDGITVSYTHLTLPTN